MAMCQYPGELRHFFYRMNDKVRKFGAFWGQCPCGLRHFFYLIFKVPNVGYAISCQCPCRLHLFFYRLIIFSTICAKAMAGFIPFSTLRPMARNLYLLTCVNAPYWTSSFFYITYSQRLRQISGIHAFASFFPFSTLPLVFGVHGIMHYVSMPLRASSLFLQRSCQSGKR